LRIVECGLRIKTRGATTQVPQVRRYSGAPVFVNDACMPGAVIAKVNAMARNLIQQVMAERVAYGGPQFSATRQQVYYDVLEAARSRGAPDVSARKAADRAAFLPPALTTEQLATTVTRTLETILEFERQKAANETAPRALP
jgi:hypothetical protein